MKPGKAHEVVLILTFVVSVVVMTAGIYVFLHILFKYGFSYGDVYDRSGRTIGRISYIYGGGIFAFFGILSCAIVSREVLKKFIGKDV